MHRPPVHSVLISAVFPVFNEQDVLDELIARTAKAIAGTGALGEIICVNDGSTDQTGPRLDALARRYPQLQVVHLSRNFGHQAAVQAGLDAARGDVVVLMDSDLQDPPEAMNRFLQEWRAGYDVVYAVRASRQEAWWKRALFAGFHRFLARISHTAIPREAGNFSLMDARVVRQIVSLEERDRYLPGLRAWVGFRQKGVEVRRDARYDGTPRVSLRGLWRLAKTAIYSFSSFPLAMFSLIGYAALAVFLGLAIFAISCKLFTGLAIPGWTSNVLVASFFGAVNAMGISILGEYAIRIYDQVRGRPMYLVARTVTGECGAEPPTIPLSARTALGNEALSALADEDFDGLLQEAQDLLDHARTPAQRQPGEPAR